ncbi:MAG: CBS domain-containing protein [Nitrospirae bacterium]|nr:CBS domain-containing protein [Nitrospirota bacterium]
MSIDAQGLTMTVYTVTPEALACEVATLMVTQRVGDVIVVEEKKPVGILTDRDLVARVMAAGLESNTVLVRDIMSAPPVTVPRNQELRIAIELMSLHGIRRLPIVDEEGRLVSILTLDDIIMLGLDGQPELSNIVQRQLRLGNGPLPPPLPEEGHQATTEGSPRPAAFSFSGTVEQIARSTVVIPITRRHLRPPPPYSDILARPQSFLDPDRRAALDPRSTGHVGDTLFCRRDLSLRPAILRTQGPRASASTVGTRTQEARGAQTQIGVASPRRPSQTSSRAGRGTRALHRSEKPTIA